MAESRLRYSSDGTSRSGNSTLLKHTKIRGKSCLFIDSRLNTSKKGKRRRANLDESEDVIDEKKLENAKVKSAKHKSALGAIAAREAKKVK